MQTAERTVLGAAGRRGRRFGIGRPRVGALAPHLILMVIAAAFILLVFAPIWLSVMAAWVLVLGVVWVGEGAVGLVTGRPKAASAFLAEWLGWFAEPWYWGSKRNAARRAARLAARESTGREAGARATAPAEGATPP